MIEKQIRKPKEDQEYAGGLIKAIIGSSAYTLKQTHAMLQQRAKASYLELVLNILLVVNSSDTAADAAVQLVSWSVNLLNLLPRSRQQRRKPLDTAGPDSGSIIGVR
ncbi:MAG: hypothetical protein IPL59_18550 [Candidatus Competibacteraceae bacterium]|nr:hypothetical protein [Candidatus Competibacteraceae bacterium]